jgi:glycosyltransferase involved in cell wall biosynthesis
MGPGKDSLKGLRIFFVFGCLELGGSERQGLQLAAFLKAECGADVNVIGLCDTSGAVAELCDREGIPWHAVKFCWSRFWPLRVKELARFARRLSVWEPNVLMPYYTLPNTVCGLVWKKVGARLCIWNQRDEGLILTRGIWHRKAVNQIPLFISNSGVGKEFLVRTYGLEPDRIALIHNGVLLAPPLHGREEWRRNLGTEGDAFVACMIANLGPYKDHATLLRAWREVLDKAGSSSGKPILLIAGKPDARELRLKELASKLELGKSVIFLGKVDDISGLLSSADICVHSSKTEGCPNGILEAMASGLAVAATDIPGIREAVGPEGFRFLSPVGDYRGLAQNILSFHEDPVLRNNIGAQMKGRIESEFSVSRLGRKTMEILRYGLGKGSGMPR